MEDKRKRASSARPPKAVLLLVLGPGVHSGCTGTGGSNTPVTGGDAESSTYSTTTSSEVRDHVFENNTLLTVVTHPIYSYYTGN